MDVYKEQSYKTIVKKRVRELASAGRPINLSRLAKHVGIQYTYLSKVLNSDCIHLNEDHLFEISNYLGFMSDEAEYITLLRAFEATANQNRKQLLHGKIRSLQNKLELRGEKVTASANSREMQFLLSPLAYLTHFALELESVRPNPRKLVNILGISLPQLKSILHTLADLDLIETEGDIFNIKAVKKNHFHYGPDHPLMRYHQHMLQKFCETQLMKLPEGEKNRYQFTFNTDEKTFAEIKQRFQVFMNEIEKIILPTKSENTYQLNFDLFRWF